VLFRSVVPNCFSASLPPEVTEATMYNFQDSGEVKKATLEQDDLEGVCGAYPTASDPDVCERALESDDGWCSVAPHAQDRPWTRLWPLALLGLVLAATRRRRLPTA